MWRTRSGSYWPYCKGPSNCNHMAQPNPPGTRSSSHKSGRRARVPGVLAHLWSEWRVELIIVALLAFAVFLLVERMQIRQTLLRWVQGGLGAVRNLGVGAVTGLVDFIQNSTLSDLTAYGLILISLMVVIWRTRWRLMTMPRFTASKCPKCGSDLRRIHRRGIDRLLGLFVPTRRYQCKNAQCDWQGVRIKRSHHK